ncbi:hypothetical protein [Flavobacterium pedocola]
MEPNRMEEAFRKKLNEREIQPSGAAWDRLDAMLSVAEESKPKRSLTWLYVAAGVAVFFAVGSFLFQQEKANTTVSPNVNDAVVNTDTATKTENTSEDSNIVAPAVFEEGAQNEAIAESRQNGSVKVVKQDNTTAKSSVLPQQQFKKEAVASTEPKTNEVQKTTPEPEKMLAVNEAPKEKPKVKVNANSLLSSVEGELNEEFRETTLDKIKKNFKTVKTAVANRNYE